MIAQFGPFGAFIFALIAGALILTAAQAFDLGQRVQAHQDIQQAREWVKKATFPTVQVANGEAVAIISGGICVPGVNQLPAFYKIQRINPFSAPCHTTSLPLQDSAALAKIMEEMRK